MWDFCGNQQCLSLLSRDNATGAPRAVLVRSVTYEFAKYLSEICKPLVGSSDLSAGKTKGLQKRA
jgi:hypothetical protein